MIDRTTTIGKMIDSYLTEKAELDDRAVHLLFSANRWEAAYIILSACIDGWKTDGTIYGKIKYFVVAGIGYDGRLRSIRIFRYRLHRRQGTLYPSA